MAGAQAPTPLVLQVLSGPNQGAEAPLYDGVYIIGADDESDFVLTDPALLPAHAQLSVSGGKVQCIARENAPAYLQGVALDAGGAEIPNFTVLTLGATHLAIGPARTVWPQLELPKIVPAATPEKNSEERPAAVEKPELPSGAVKPVLGDRVREARRRASRWVTPETLVILLLLLNIVFVWRIWNGQNAGLADLRADESQLEGLLAEFGKRGAILARTRYHGIEGVKGYVKDYQQFTDLKSKIYAIQPRTIVRVWDTKTLARSVRQVATTAKIRNLQVTPGGPGEVLVVGPSPQPIGWRGLQQRVLEQVRPLQRLTIQSTDKSLPPVGLTVSRIWVDEDEDVAVPLPEPQPPEPTEAEAKRLAATAADKRSVNGGFEATDFPDEGSQAGEANGEMGPNSEALAFDDASANAYLLEGAPEFDDSDSPANQSFSNETSRQRAARIAQAKSKSKLNAKTANKSKRSLKLDLQSLSVGAAQTITLPGAKRLFPGAELDDGSQIKTITSEGVMVIQNGVEHFYRLGTDIEGGPKP